MEKLIGFLLDTIRALQQNKSKQRVFEVFSTFYPSFSHLLEFLNLSPSGMKDYMTDRYQMDSWEIEDFVTNLSRSYQRVLVVGDRDTDGILSSNMLALFLRKLGHTVYGPVIVMDRKEPIKLAYEYAVDRGLLVDSIVVTDLGTNDTSTVRVPVYVIDHHVSEDGKRREGAINPEANGISAGFLTFLVLSQFPEFTEEDFRNLFPFAAATLVSDIADIHDVPYIFIEHAAFMRGESVREYVNSVRYQVSPYLNAFGKNIPEGEVVSLTPFSYGAVQRIFRSSYLRYKAQIEQVKTKRPVKVGDEVYLYMVDSSLRAVKGILASRGLYQENLGLATVAVAEEDGEFLVSVRSKVPLFDIVRRRVKAIEAGGHPYAFGMRMTIHQFQELLDVLSTLSIDDLDIPTVYDDVRLQEVSNVLSDIPEIVSESVLLDSPPYRVLNLEVLYPHVRGNGGNIVVFKERQRLFYTL